MGLVRKRSVLGDKVQQDVVGLEVCQGRHDVLAIPYEVQGLPTMTR